MAQAFSLPVGRGPQHRARHAGAAAARLRARGPGVCGVFEDLV